MVTPGDAPFLANMARPLEVGSRLQYILIVDDDEPMRQTLLRLLATSDRVLEEADSVESTLEMLAGQSYDLILLDYRLPDGDGLAVLDWLSEHQRGELVVMLSGEDAIDAAIGALRRGADDFVRKPYRLSQLNRAVDNALLKTQLQRSNHEMGLRLQESERLHRYLVESSPDLIFTLDTAGRFTYINPRIEVLLGFTRAELEGRAFSSIVSSEDVTRIVQLFETPLQPARTAHSLELRLRSQKLGLGPLTVSLNTEPMYGRGDERNGARFLGTYGVARDISDRKRAEEIIAFQAYHDQLTRLPNRTLFRDRLDLAIAQTDRRKGSLAVLFIDVDRFKLVNDTYGHSQGDQLLRSIASRLRQTLRRGDTLARVGGDEFLALLPDITHPEDVQAICQKILDALRAPFRLQHGEFSATVSIGIAMYQKDGESADMLTQHADIAMYKAKRSGKNGFCFFDSSLNSNYRERITLENDLRKAIDRGELELFYQAQVSIAKRRVVGTEALLRWHHPEHGLLGPDTFVPLAEEAGLITGISNWVVDTACAQLRDWRDIGFHDLRMSINLSPRDFEQGEIVETVKRSIAHHRLDAASLDLEITESLMMQDAGSVRRKVHALREAGVGVAIDDFGTGYSALAYLQKFPVSSLKIDRGFVHDLNGKSSPIIAAITGIARGFGLQVVAEGVEHQGQIAHLRSLGCDTLQGFLFSKPVPAAEAASLFLEIPSGLPA